MHFQKVAWNNLPLSAKQVVAFVVVGFVQVALDAQLLVLLVDSGAAIGMGNVLSRLCAAIVGYYLNRFVTFGLEARKGLHGAPLVRYVVLWGLLTLTGSVVLEILNTDKLLPLLLAKLLMEAFLACLSFTAMKYWVFR